MEKLIVELIPIINSEKKYWLVRTEGGRYYDSYRENKFISIGWNDISSKDIAHDVKNSKRIIAKKYNFDLSKTRGKQKVSTIYNKIKRFSDLRKGDIVVIPNNGSARLTFGEIIDDEIYSRFDKFENNKRRKVKWHLEKRINQLHPNFFRMLSTHHAISSVDKYSEYIDSVTNSLYIKNNVTNFVFDVQIKEDISSKVLSTLMYEVNCLIENINTDFKLGENLNSLSVKMNLESPGKLSFQNTGKALAIFGLILASYSCNSKNKEYKKVEPRYINNLKKIDEGMKILKVDKNITDTVK